MDAAFADFNAAIRRRAAIAAGSGPLARLRAGCAAYLRFAAERPNRYKILFERQILVDVGRGQGPRSGPRASTRWSKCLQDCIDAGISASTDPELDSMAIWVALHGYATLHALVADFPWPDTDIMLDRIIDGLAQITSHD